MTCCTECSFSRMEHQLIDIETLQVF